MTTDSSAQTPRILPYSRHYQLRFERKKKWMLSIDATRLSGPNIPKDELRQLQALESARDNVSPVSFTDLDGRIWTVFVTKIGNTLETIDGQNKVWAIPIELLEWRSGQGVNYYNSASVIYDQNAKYSSGTDSNKAYYS